MYEQIIKSFYAMDEDGTVHEILVFQQCIECRAKGGTSVARGLKRLETSTGLSVNFIDHKTFEIVQTGQRLRKVRKRHRIP